MAAAPSDNGKHSAIDLAITQIERTYGKGSIMRMGESVHDKVPVVSTGSISLDLALAGAWVNVSDQLPPVVTSHFPADGTIVGARRPKVVFAFSEPLQAGSVESGAVTVLGEGSGVIPGVVSYDTGRWLVTWTPQQDLAPADTYHVTLDGRRLEDLAGNEPAASVSFSFKTAP